MAQSTFEEIIRLAERLTDQERRALVEYLQKSEGERSFPTPEEQVRAVRRRAYEDARRYWRETGDEARFALTDDQLDEQFWLFDGEGIPRLKSDEGTFELRDDSLYRLGEALESAGFASGETDIAERSREILNTEYAEYLIRRMERQDHDADSGSDG